MPFAYTRALPRRLRVPAPVRLSLAGFQATMSGVSSAEQHTIRLLRRLSEGDATAYHQLMPLVYAELRTLAERALHGRAAGTLQATALIHEAWLKLVRQEDPQFESRRHFLGVAAKAMRSVLVDHARARRAAKRGGDAGAVPLEDASVMDAGSDALIDLDHALTRLAEIDPELVRVVELRFFAGLSADESSKVLGVSKRTVERAWRVARAWLQGAGKDGEHAG